MTWSKKEFTVTDELSRVDIDKVYDMLSKTYWASNIAKDLMADSFKTSICFSVFEGKEQVAFARVVTDYAIFSWICDVVVDDEYRGRGLGKLMMDCISNHEIVKDTKQLLATKDAHGLYEKYGFAKCECMRKTPDCFK